jgi:hypothetical protein
VAIIEWFKALGELIALVFKTAIDALRGKPDKFE